MTQREKNALMVHNSIFTLKAIQVETLSEPYRFKVIYEDGSVKYDYECGFFTNEIALELF